MLVQGPDALVAKSINHFAPRTPLDLLTALVVATTVVVWRENWALVDTAPTEMVKSKTTERECLRAAERTKKNVLVKKDRVLQRVLTNDACR
jgi:hypothetical protein